MIKSSLAGITRLLLSRRSMYGLNLHLYKLSLRGMGILNSGTESATGEPWFQKLIQERLSPKIVFDVGANDSAYGVGVFSKAKIFAFEPHPASFKRLKTNSLSSVKPVWAAVGEKNGKTTLWDFAENSPRKKDQPTSQLASIHKAVMSDMYKQPAIAYQVPLVSLDSFARKNHCKKIDLLKIDAEGNELAVLKGSSQLIKDGAISVIQFEFNEMHAYTNVHMHDFIELLPNYSFYRLLPKELLPLNAYRPLTHEIFGFQNIICIHTSIRKSFQNI